MHSKALLSLALTLVPLASAEVGPFFDYCTSNSLYYSTINSKCTNGDASLDLNGGIALVDGSLVWRYQADPNNGGFYANCGSNAGGNCDLNYSTLSCYCYSGRFHDTKSIGLNKHLWYNTETNQLYFNGYD